MSVPRRHLDGRLRVAVVAGFAALALGTGTAHADNRVDGLEPGRVPTDPTPAGAAAQSVAPAFMIVAEPGVPPRSGRGRRVVFDAGAQRVWLVARNEAVRRTYLVSGSLTDNLPPGRYAVYSRSRHAVGIDDSGTMRYMVRFAYGRWAAIGFHDIPVRRGRPVQTRAELGSPQSHGCIRQARPDAKALWDFASVGTRVVVVD